MASNNLTFDIIARDKASATFNKVSNSVDKTSASVNKSNSTFSKFGGVALKAGALLGGLGFAAAIKGSIGLEAAFGQTMATIKASTGASASEMKKFNDLAIKLGADTSFSAGEAADAMLELAKAGLSTSTIMGGGVAGTLTLAAAGGTDLATAATIASNALNTFNLKGKDMKSVAAALAGGANASSASVESLGVALQQVGPGATNAGLSLQETVAALAAFDSAGIKGSDAGTSLKTMLSRLVPQTKKSSDAMRELGINFVDARGNFKSITDIAEILHDKMGKLTQAERTKAMATIFGSDATRAATVLMNDGAKGLGKFIKATSDQSAAQKMAAARMSGTAGALDRLKGSVETVALRFGQEMAPAVQNIANWLSVKLVPAAEKIITVFKRDMIPVVKDWGTVFKQALVVVGKALEPVGKFLNDLPGPIKSIGVEAGIAALILPRLAAGFTAASTAVRVNATALAEWAFFAKTASTRAEATQIAIAKVGAVAKQAAGIGGMLLLANSFTKAAGEGNSFSSVLTGAVGGALTGFAVGGPVGAAVGALVGGGGSALLGAFKNTTAEAEKNAAALRRLNYQKAVANIQALRATLDQATGAYTKNTKAAIDNWLHTDEAGQKVFASLNGMHLPERTIIASLLGSPEANAKIAAKFGGQLASLDAQIAASKARMADLLKGNEFGQVSQADIDLYHRLKDSVGALESQRSALAESKHSLGKYGVEVNQAAKEQREFFRATAPIRQILKITRKAYLNTFDKKVRGVLQVDGVPTSIKAIQKVAREAGGLTRKQWKVLLKADGIDVTKRALDGLVKTGTAKGADTGKGFARQVNAGLANGADTWIRTLFAQVTKTAAATAKTASIGGRSVGTNLKAGLLQGFAGTASALAAEAASAVRQAIAAARQAADIHSPSRKTWEIGALMIEGLVKGIESHEVPLAKVLDKVTAHIQAQADKIRNLMGKRSDLVSSFQGFTSSAFSADFTNPDTGASTATPEAMIAWQQKEKAKAERLRNDTRKLLKMGLSRNLIQQLAASGESGMAQIHALAGGTAAQVQQLNALNAQTQSALTGAGTLAGNNLYASDINDAKRDKALAQAIAQALREEQRKHPKDEIHIHLEGKEIVYSVNRYQEGRGKDMPFP